MSLKVILNVWFKIVSGLHIFVIRNNISCTILLYYDAELTRYACKMNLNPKLLSPYVPNQRGYIL